MTKFYQQYKNEPIIATETLNVDKSLFGGNRLIDFLAEIGSNAKSSKNLERNLFEYNNVITIVKSRFTVMYNKIRYLNKLLTNVMFYSLFKLVAFNDIVNEKVVLNRFVNIQDLKGMIDIISGYLASKQDKVKICEAVGAFSINLFQKTIEKITNPAQCIDITKSNYVVDYVLGIYLATKLGYVNKTEIPIPTVPVGTPSIAVAPPSVATPITTAVASSSTATRVASPVASSSRPITPAVPVATPITTATQVASLTHKSVVGRQTASSELKNKPHKSQKKNP